MTSVISEILCSSHIPWFQASCTRENFSHTFVINKRSGPSLGKKKLCYFPSMGFQEGLNLHISTSNTVLKSGGTKWLPHQLFLLQRDDFWLYQNHSDIYGKKPCIPDTHIPFVASAQQLLLGTLTKRGSNFIHIQYIPFSRVTVTQGKFFRNVRVKKVSNICHKITGCGTFLFPPLMTTMGQISLVFRQKIRPWHGVSLVSLILRNLSLTLQCKMQCSTLVQSSYCRRTQGQQTCPC